MNFTFLCLVITQYLFILDTHALYNKDVICVMDKGHDPVCRIVPKIKRRNSVVDNTVPTHDPYIPRTHAVLYNCSSTECVPLQLHSITQVSSPELHLKSCYAQPDKYECDTIRYNYFKNIDKLLFLTNNVRNKTFYLVDCLVYTDRGRVCHKKDVSDSHAKLVDTGTIVRPNEPNVLSQDEFLCEEGDDYVHCDLNPFVPFAHGLKLKESSAYKDSILLKAGNYVVDLQKNCVDTWCGFTGFLSKKISRRFYGYTPPGGKTFRCYYAKKQQICKVINEDSGMHYNMGRDWLAF